MSEADLREAFIQQLDSAIARFVPGSVVAASTFVAAGLAAIDRVAGTRSAYAEQARSIIHAYGDYHNNSAASVLGVVKALRDDVEAGFMVSVRELIHGEVFGDFLEMAHFLASEGYKDAAAVIGGGVLESHLRQLCVKFQVETDFVNARSDTESKKADRLNADLRKADAYNGLDQKSVTTWLDLRNKAAHAEYGEYGKEEVSLFLRWLTDFLTRNPA